MSNTCQPMVRKVLLMPATLVEQVTDFRFSRRLDSEAEALRQLIEKGLEAERSHAHAGA